MRKIYLTILTGLLSTVVHPQDVKLEWAKSVGGVSGEFSKSVTPHTLYSSGRVVLRSKPGDGALLYCRYVVD